jgi:hypothetical protein
MIDHVWTVVCTRALIDRDTNNISLVEVLEQLTVAGALPETINLVMEIVTLWERHDLDAPARGRAQVRLVTPDGQLANPLQYDVDLTTHVRTRSRVQVPGFPFRGFGRYEFRLELQPDGGVDWHEVSRTPLQIVAATEQIAAPGAT